MSGPPAEMTARIAGPAVLTALVVVPPALPAFLVTTLTEVLILGLFGQHPRINPVRDERIPEGTTMSAGYTPGVPRLGVPALQMSDASMGVTNPGYTGRDAVYFYLAESLARTAKTAEAIPYFQRLLDEFMTSEFLEDARERLEQLKVQQVTTRQP